MNLTEMTAEWERINERRNQLEQVRRDHANCIMDAAAANMRVVINKETEADIHEAIKYCNVDYVRQAVRTLVIAGGAQ